jgi:CubicO group peptidase (beta-lactamase class C family)
MSRAEHKIDSYPLQVSVMSYALTPLKTQPGTKYDYSNAGINTAGRIIEVVSGMPYEQFMEKRLFKPLGMKDTTFWLSDAQVNRLAKSYKPNVSNDGLMEIPIDQLTYPLTDRHRGPCPAGGYFSTASDFSLFCRMILNGGQLNGKRYLSPAAVREMTATQTGNLLDKDKGEQGYGLGWSTTRKTPVQPDAPVTGACGHGGAYSTHFWIDPERGLITIFMVQHAGYPGKDGGKIQPAFAKAAVEKYGEPGMK